jgi:signal transduction histidine kinase
MLRARHADVGRVAALRADDRARLLVVDDEQANVRLLERMLARAGFSNVASTTDPKQVVPLYHRFDPDLILLDLGMPQLDGYAVMAELSHAVPDGTYLPILVLTAETSAEARQRALSAGAKDFLLKPFDLTEVLLRIANLLETRRLHVELQGRNRLLEERVRERTAELERRAEALARSTADLAQFAHAAAHELAEPLRAVAHHLQLFERNHATALGDGAEREIELALAGVVQMNSLLADLLAYSQAATAEPVRVPVAGDLVVASSLARLDAAIARTGAKVTVDPLPVVLGDPAHLAQVFDHLLRNAIKFHGTAPPRVHVSAERSGTEWRISVADDGIGIAPRHAERIFTLFQRLHHRSEYDGNGVGLSLCRRLVAHHGGRVWVDPNPGGGSVFRFTVPAAEPAGDATDG